MDTSNNELSSDDEEEDKCVPERNSFVKYKLSDLLFQFGSSKHAISLLLSGTSCYSCYCLQGSYMVAEVKVVPNSASFLHGCWFHEWLLCQGASDSSLGSVPAHEYGVLLPKLFDNQTKYTMITSKWMVVNEFGNLVFPNGFTEHYR